MAISDFNRVIVRRERIKMGEWIKPGMMKYCVIGNIVKEHVDENGILRHGTASFPGGRKVYISKDLWEDSVFVLGLNRYKSRYVYDRIPLDRIESIRYSKTFKPRVLELMENNSEFLNTWWTHKDSDLEETIQFVRTINRIKAGDRLALEEYLRKFAEQYNDALDRNIMKWRTQK